MQSGFLTDMDGGDAFQQRCCSAPASNSRMADHMQEHYRLADLSPSRTARTTALSHAASLVQISESEAIFFCRAGADLRFPRDAFFHGFALQLLQRILADPAFGPVLRGGKAFCDGRGGRVQGRVATADAAQGPVHGFLDEVSFVAGSLRHSR